MSRDAAPASTGSGDFIDTDGGKAGVAIGCIGAVLLIFGLWYYFIRTDKSDQSFLGEGQGQEQGQGGG